MTKIRPEAGSLREVFTLSWPLMIGTLSYTVMDVSDTLFCGWIGKTELAAAGLATATLFLFNAFFIGFFESVKILVAQYYGAKDIPNSKRAGIQGLILTVPSMLAIMSLSFFSEEILTLYGTSDTVLKLAIEYFDLRIFSSPAWFPILAIGAYFQGIGRPKIAMNVNILICVLNIFFNYIFMFGIGSYEGMGFIGSAWGTIVSDTVGCLVVLVFFFRSMSDKWRFDLTISKKLFKLGFPMGIRWMLDIAGWTLCLTFVASLGENELASHQIVTRIMMILILPIYGISEGVAILTGQYTGAKKPELVEKSWRSALLLVAIIMAACTALDITAGKWMISAFQSDPAIIERGMELLMMVVVFQIFQGLNMTTAAALNGTGDTRYTMFVSIIFSWAVMVPASYLFANTCGFGALGVWMGFTLNAIAMVVAMAIRFTSGKWRGHSEA